MLTLVPFGDRVALVVLGPLGALVGFVGSGGPWVFLPGCSGAQFGYWAFQGPLGPWCSRALVSVGVSGRGFQGAGPGQILS